MTGTITAATWRVAEVNHRQQILMEELDELRDDLDERTRGRWTIDDMEDWLERANREVEIWSMQSEIVNKVPPGSWVRFCFPPTRAKTKAD